LTNTPKLPDRFKEEKHRDLAITSLGKIILVKDGVVDQEVARLITGGKDTETSRIFPGTGRVSATDHVASIRELKVF